MKTMRCSNCSLEVGIDFGSSGLIFSAELVFFQTSADPQVLKGRCPKCSLTLAYKSLSNDSLYLRSDRLDIGFPSSETVLTNLVKVQRKIGLSRQTGSSIDGKRVAKQPGVDRQSNPLMSVKRNRQS